MMTMMSEQATNASGAVASDLHEIDGQYEKYRRYKLIDGDGVAIEVTAGDLADAYEMRVQRDLFVLNLTQVMRDLIQWCRKHRHLIDAALLSVKSGRSRLFLVPSTSRYNLALDDEMTELELRIANTGIGSFETFQVPKRSLDQYVDDRAIILWTAQPMVSGESDDGQGAVET